MPVHPPQAPEVLGVDDPGVPLEAACVSCDDLATVKDAHELLADTRHENVWNAASAWASGIVTDVPPVSSVRIAGPLQLSLSNTLTS